MVLKFYLASKLYEKFQISGSERIYFIYTQKKKYKDYNEDSVNCWHYSKPVVYGVIQQMDIPR